MTHRQFQLGSLLAIWLCASSVLAMDIQVLGLFNNFALLDVDGKQRKLHVGEVSPEGIKLIAADSDKAVLEVKGKQKTYSLGQKISASFASDGRKAEASIWPNHGLYIIPGSINNQPVQFMVDTGASWVAMNTRMARKLGINYRYEGDQSVAGTAAGNVRVYLVKLQSVKVGEIELQNVEGAVIDSPTADEILLGASFLNRVDLMRQGQMMMLREK